MTPVFCCGFECGQLGSAGQHWSVIGTASIDTSTIRTGARSLRINPAAAAGRGILNATISASITNKAAVRFYVRFASLPTNGGASFFDILGLPTLGGRRAGVIFQESDSSLYTALTGGTSSLTGIPITTGQWYMINYSVNMSANPWSQKLQVNGVEVTSSTGVAADTVTSMSIGGQQTTTADIYFDDFILSSVDTDYPISAGQVLHFVPTSDGTHTATTTTIVKGTIAAPTAGGNVAGSADVFNWVNGVPLLGGATDNTRLVNQQTAGTTLYAECIFGAAPSVTYPIVAPRAVEVITADREATTATCDFTAKINDNGTESTIIARGVVAGVITDRYATKQFATPPTGGAWNMKATGAGSFKNLRARWGYASDATPDLYWRGIMVEAEFGYPPPPTININQSVNRASTY